MNATIRHGALAVAVVVGLGAVSAGCLTRPVEHADPVTKTNVAITVPNQVIDKIDMLFDIDNSASMGDKQSYLEQAIPDLINRLINPYCLDATQAVVGTSNAGVCTTGKAEFPAVHDMHLGIVTSSLGPRLSETLALGGVCNPTTAPMPFTNLDAHNDDQGHLIARSLTNLTMPPVTEAPVADAVIAAYGNSPSGFLYWYPNGTMPMTPGTVITDPMKLQNDFQSMVSGVGIFGCGIESQLESWYRFLIQPDPYASLVLTNGKAAWSGVDTTILQERHDFLRPDSLVAIVVLSDENDSEIDVRSLGGQGYLFMQTGFHPPHGTSACATDPASAGCISCPSGSTDPACSTNYSAANDWGYDPNLRHVHMKYKYGLDPQYPIGRYWLGLTQSVVPDRNGEYPAGANNYVGNPDCTNPLFAASLPTTYDPNNAAALCQLPLGPRQNQKNLIFYAHIGGVPYQLLHFKPNDAAASTLTQADWVNILGQGAASYSGIGAMSYDYTGIDPHMIESYQPRMGGTIAAPTTTGNPDPISGREWITDQEQTPGTHVLPVDREYACIFPLAAPRDCTQAVNGNSCDCPATAMGLTHEQTPPLCDDANPTSQTYAKAYPTIRELLLAKLMGDQGIVSSICPQSNATMDSTGQPNPLYGYRPAVAVIIDRLKVALTGACLPQKLQADDAGTVPCLILVTLNDKGSCKNPTCTAPGLSGPDPVVLDKFCDTQEQIFMSEPGSMPGSAEDPATHSVCQMTQLTSAIPGALDSTGSCSSSSTPGWCYATGAGANGCAQAIEFSSRALPSGATASLQCIEQSVGVVGQ